MHNFIDMLVYNDVVDTAPTVHEDSPGALLARPNQSIKCVGNKHCAGGADLN